MDWGKTWRWIQKGDLKGCTEALTCSAQEQALRTNYTKFHTDKNKESPMCGKKGESKQSRACASKRQRNGENRKVPTSEGRNTKAVEAEESHCSTSCDQSVRGCIRLEVIQKTALLGAARLLRNVLSLLGIRGGYPWAF